jgi:hypothetical protein
VLEYIAAELLELAGNASRDNKKERIVPRHLHLAVRNDSELNNLLANAVVQAGGVIPNIHAALFPISPSTTGIHSVNESTSPNPSSSWSFQLPQSLPVTKDSTEPPIHESSNHEQSAKMELYSAQLKTVLQDPSPASRLAVYKKIHSDFVTLIEDSQRSNLSAPSAPIAASNSSLSENRNEEDDVDEKKGREGKALGPKKPRSAYNFFCHVKRPEIQADHPNVPFSQIGKMLGEAWRSVSATEKTKYEEMARQDKGRYANELAALK